MKDSVGLLLKNPDGLYWLQFRDNAPQNTAKLIWDVFGGHMKPNETPEECASREMNEELDIPLNAGEFTILGSFEKEGGGTMYCAAHPGVFELADMCIAEGAGLGFFSAYDVSCLQPIFTGAREMFRLFAE